MKGHERGIPLILHYPRILSEYLGFYSALLSQSLLYGDKLRALFSLSEYQHTVDFLLVNLPHQTIEHMEDLLPLMKRETPSLIRGWAIIDRDDLPSVNDKLTNLLLHHGATNLQLVCQERKGFSATKIIIRIESSQTFI